MCIRQLNRFPKILRHPHSRALSLKCRMLNDFNASRLMQREMAATSWTGSQYPWCTYSPGQFTYTLRVILLLMIELRFYLCGNRWCAHLIHFQFTRNHFELNSTMPHYYVAISIGEWEFWAFFCAFSNQTVKLITNHCTEQNRTMDPHYLVWRSPSPRIFIFIFFLLLGIASFPIFTFAATQRSHVQCSLVLQQSVFSYKMWPASIFFESTLLYE